MKVFVTIKYRDDKEETFTCIDHPSIGDWITIYLENFKRLTIPKDAIASIATEIK